MSATGILSVNLHGLQGRATKAQRIMGQLERQLLTRRMIADNLFCGNCGYNLRTRPTIGICPECGHEYDARPVSMQGILLDDDISFPFAELAGMLALSGLGLGALYAAVYRGVEWMYVPGGMFTLLGVIYVGQTFRKTARYLHHRRLLHDAEDDE